MSPIERAIRTDGDAIVDDVRHVLVEVYGYVLHRCRSKALAEDLTAEAVLAAVDRLRAGHIDRLTVPYVIGIASHKLVDHWRRTERERSHLMVVAGSSDTEFAEDSFEPGRADDALAAVSPIQRAALVLRYVDDLSVPAVADALGRSIPATETLLVRARSAFRHHYSHAGAHDDD
jgi:RNA polymerase sigma-70 factor (ECF subfamily)